MCVKNHPIIINDFEDIEGSWLEIWRTLIIVDHIIVLNILFPNCVPNFSFLAWLEMCQEPPHHQWLGGHLGFLIKDMEDMGLPWPHSCSLHRIPGLCAKLQHSSMIRSVSREFLTGDLSVILEVMNVLSRPPCSYLYIWQRYKGVLPW